MKELEKTCQEGLIFHSFSEEQLSWKDVIFVHFGDAAQGIRPCGGDAGGFIASCIPKDPSRRSSQDERLGLSVMEA